MKGRGTTRKIEVTDDDIENGVRCTSGACPIALAAKRAGLGRVSLGPAEIAWGRFYEHERDLPREAVDFIADFDNGRPVKPFSFEVEL